MLINLSNHPSTKWTTTQHQTAIEKYGTIKDIPFPNIPPAATEAAIKTLAQSYIQKIKATTGSSVTVHVMGEMTFVFQIVTMLKNEGIECIASTTERNTIENEDGSKTFKFQFVQFRKYG